MTEVCFLIWDSSIWSKDIQRFNPNAILHIFQDHFCQLYSTVPSRAEQVVSIQSIIPYTLCHDILKCVIFHVPSLNPHNYSKCLNGLKWKLQNELAQQAKCSDFSQARTEIKWWDSVCHLFSHHSPILCSMNAGFAVKSGTQDEITEVYCPSQKTTLGLRCLCLG